MFPLLLFSSVINIDFTNTHRYDTTGINDIDIGTFCEFRIISFYRYRCIIDVNLPISPDREMTSNIDEGNH